MAELIETRPPHVSDRDFFERYLDALPVRPSEAWPAFQDRPRRAGLAYSLAASAVYSSNIEGIAIDLDEYLGTMPPGSPAPKRKERAEVAAVQAAYELARKRDLTESALLQAHGLIGEPTLIASRRGRYREERIGVGGPRGLVYVAVEPDRVVEEMAALFADVHELFKRPLSVDEAFYHAALLHVVFAHIHPFADGNGRTGRLLEKWFLAECLGPDAWFIPSEVHYLHHRAAYYEALRLGVNFYFLDYRRGGAQGEGVIPFLTMLPDALADAEPIPLVTKPLGDLIKSIDGGLSFPGEDRLAKEGELGVLKVSAVSYDRFRPEEHKVIQEDLAFNAKTRPTKDTIVMSRSNTPDLVGASVYIDRDYPDLFLPDTLWRLTAEDHVDARWLSYMMGSEEMRETFRRSASGTSGSMKKLSMQTLRKIEVLTPPLAEQRRIAETLATWDRALDRLDALIATLERRQRGLMQRLLSGQDRFPEFAGTPWPVVRFTEATKEDREPNRGQFGRDRVHGVIKGTGMVPMRARLIADDIARYKVAEPDAFGYNPMRLNIGSIARNDTGAVALVSPDYIVFSARKGIAEPAYLNHIVNSTAWKRFMETSGDGSVRVRIYYKDLHLFKHPLPSVEEQRRIADVLDAGEREIAARRAERDALARQQRGLMQRLLTGRLRVPA